MTRSASTNGKLGSLDADSATTAFAHSHPLKESFTVGGECSVRIRQRLHRGIKTSQVRFALDQPMVNPAPILLGRQKSALPQDLKMAGEVVLWLEQAINELA